MRTTRQIELKLNGGRLIRRHLRRNRFGQVILPSHAYGSFMEAVRRNRLGRVIGHTWESFNRLWRDRRAKRRAARAMRKGQRQVRRVARLNRRRNLAR